MRKTRPIHFLDDLDKKWSTNEVWKWVHGVFGKEIIEKEDEQLQKFEGKLKKKNLKTASISAKHAFFATEVSCHKDASSSRQNTQR